MYSIMETNKTLEGFAPQADVFGGGIETDVVNMENFRTAMFILQLSATDEIGTITVESCDDTSASNTTEIGFRYTKCTTTDTFSATATSDSDGIDTTADDIVILIEVDAEMLSGTDKYVRLAIAEKTAGSESAVGACSIVMSRGRYLSNANAQPSVIS